MARKPTRNPPFIHRARGAIFPEPNSFIYEKALQFLKRIRSPRMARRLHYLPASRNTNRKGHTMLVWNRISHRVVDNGDCDCDPACDCSSCESTFVLDDDTGSFSLRDFESANPDMDTSDTLAVRALSVGETHRLGSGAQEAGFVIRRVR